MEIFELLPIFDDPRFDEFDFEDARSLLDNEQLYLDFAGKNPGKLSWEPVRMAHVWTPQFAKGAVRPFVDYTRVSRIPVFSQRAVSVLREFLEPNGELLPLLTKKGTYSVYNILKKSTALDVSRSTAKFVPESSKETAFSVEYFWFDESELDGHSIFRIREYPAVVLVTDTFKRRAEQAGLNGFYFIKVWPFPEGESWDRAETLRSRELRKQQEPLRGHCLTIRLSVAGKEPTDEEGEVAYRLAQEIEELLTAGRDAKDDEFIGAVEAVEPAKREAQIILACPDADRLAAFLQPWLSSLDWPRGVKLEKQYGSRFELRVKKVREKIK
jgi:hypothetical protein